MRSKLITLLCFSLIYLSCSSDDAANNDEPCFLYSVILVTDEADCDCDSILCSTIVFVAEEEYNRLLFIKQNSNGVCPLVDVTELVTENIFSGYLVTIDKGNCPDFDFGNNNASQNKL